MKRANCFFGFLVLLAAVPALAEVRLTIALEPQSGLPAIPPTIRVTAWNSGSTEATLPNAVRLRVVPPEGEAYEPFADPRRDEYDVGFPLVEGTTITLAPAERRDLSFWAVLETPFWFNGSDPRLWRPGRHRLQLVAGTVISNEVVYTVEKPEGDDAGAWQIIRAGNAFGWPDRVAAQVWKEYPNSRYAAYAVPEPEDPFAFAQRIAYLQAAIAKAPHTNMADWHRLAIAHQETQSMKFRTEDQVREAIQANERARRILEDLQRRARDPLLRYRAKEVLRERIMTVERIRERHDFATGNYVPHVRPFVACRERTADGKILIWFGYNIMGPGPITVPIGENNKVTPPPHDRGQPTVFGGKETPFAFSVSATQPMFTWHINGKNVQARVDEVPFCPPELLAERDQAKEEH